MTKSARLLSTTIFVLAWFCVAAAQNSASFTKSYDDVRFTVWYMHWRHGVPPATPHRHDGSVVVVFLGDGVLQLPSGVKQPHHTGEAVYFEPGSSATAGELVTGSSLKAVVIELKNVAPSRPFPPSGFPPAFPRANATNVFEHATAIVWDSVIRPDKPMPLHLHDKNSVQVWVNGAVINRAHPNEAPRRETKAVGDWEMTHGGVVDSEQVVGAPAHLVTVEHK